MTYQESLEWLYSTQKFGLKLGLENTLRLLEALGNPHKATRYFHVAGTNGKGSVCAMLESVLRHAGYRTGLFTSPHLVDFCERIRISGEKVSQNFVGMQLTRIRGLVANWEHSPTFFEIVTALAFLCFEHEKCDITVLETGMGGRLDATNVVTPMVSVLTPISFDHQQWLGESIAKIAGEKAGIIKERIPVVSAWQEPDAAAVFERIADERHTSVEFVVEPVEERKLGLRGAHQKENAALVVAALQKSGLKVPEEALRKGLEKVEWPGRFQVIGEYVLDGAHNLAASVQLVKTWRENFPQNKPAIIFGALKDKDAASMLVNLREIASRFLFVPVNSARSDSPAHLTELTAPTGLPSAAYPNLGAALKAAEGARKILITGSLFLVGEALAVLQGKPQPASSLQ